MSRTVDDNVVAMARKAAMLLSEIAISDGKDRRQPVCGRFGGELFVVATSYLEPMQTNQVPENMDRVHKLLRFLERVCSGSRKVEKGRYPTLFALIGDDYIYAEQAVRRGLLRITAIGPGPLDDAINKMKEITRPAAKRVGQEDSQSTANPYSKPEPQQNDSSNALVYDALKAHSTCTCVPDSQVTFQPTATPHPSLLLMPAFLADADKDSGLNFFFLGSSPGALKMRRTWQDVRLKVFKVNTTHHAKEVRFSHHSRLKSPSDTETCTEKVVNGEFCQLIHQHLHCGSVLRLAVRQGVLHKLLDCELPDMTLSRSQCITLSEVLESYRLSRKMKLVLAYIVAASVWYFYPSDHWMKTRWTSDTVVFMRHSSTAASFDRINKDPLIYPARPYVSVRFDEEDPDSSAREWSNASGEIHRYSRVRALGIMLVEIAIGARLVAAPDRDAEVSEIRKNNDELNAALEYSQQDHQREESDIDIDSYWKAARYCLSPSSFNDSATRFDPNDDDRARAQKLSMRRKLLHENVVSPLHYLLDASGWEHEVAAGTTTTSLKSSISTTPSEMGRKPPQKDRHDPPNIRDTKPTKFPRKKEAEEWLKQISRVRAKLQSDSSGPSAGRVRVRIAVLDTGFDPDAAFFQGEGRYDRLEPFRTHWKDWVERGNQTPKDTDGHGTHLVSLIMQIAPEAEIFVARVFKDKQSLADTSASVAEAITWAQSECKADIVSMSFGYSTDEACIRTAIDRAVDASGQGILFFAAAANSGANKEEMFPARYSKVTSIRATDRDGHFESFNPPRNPNERRVFGCLGLDVPSAGRESQVVTCKSGTSVANAVAVGLAGMFLGYVEMQRTRRDATYQELRNGLRKQSGMEALFDRLGVTTLGQEGCSYVAPWILEGMTPEARWSLFHDAAGKSTRW